MLQSIHNATKNWIGYIILFVLVMFLVGAFALWGVGDIFRGGVDTTVAEVGGRSIDRADYDRELKSQIRQLSAGQDTELSMDQVRAIGLDKIVLDRMIERTAIDERMAYLGLTASDEAVRARIERDPAFRGTSGMFDKDRFSRLLMEAGVSEGQYVEGIRGDIARQQYILAAVAGVEAPPRLARLLYDYQNEQRVAEYLVLAPEAAGNPPEPTEAQLVAYHKAHADMFSTPEYREIEFVEIGVNEVADEIHVSDEELKAAWERHKDEYQKPEQRELEQVTFPTQAAAVAAYAKIKAGTPFLTIAHEAGKSDADVKLGTFEKTALDARLAGAAFAAAEGGVTPPVRGPFGWAILHVVHITPGQSKTFEQAREQLRTDLIKERAAERIADVSNRFEDERGADKPLTEAAKSAGLTARHVVVDAKGLAPDGTKAPIPTAPIFLQQVAATETGNESELFEGDDHTAYAVKVIGVKPPMLKPLDGVRAQVRERWLAEQRGKLLLARAVALTAQAQKEHSLAGAARALGRTVAVSPSLARTAAGDVFSAEALSKLFASSPGTAVYARPGKGVGFIVARVIKVTHPEPPSAQAILAFRGQTSGQLAQDVGRTVAMAARAEAGVEIHEQTLQAMTGEAQ